MALALAIGEAVTRYVFRDVGSTASGGGYFNRNAPPVSINHFGYRDRPFTVPKPVGVYRIVVIGDSMTYGGGLKESQRFTSLLDRDLQREGKEVLNLGMPGHNLPQYLEVLSRDALPLDPDFILLQLFVNDFESTEEGRARAAPGWFPSVHAWLIQHSALYTVADTEWGTIEGELGLVETYPQYMARLLSDQAMPASVAARTRLLTFIGTCRRAHVPLGIVFFPHFAFDLQHGYPFEYLNERVERICRDEGVPYLDLRPVFAGMPLSQREVNRFDAHPSAKASRAAADAIIASFGRLWQKPAP